MKTRATLFLLALIAFGASVSIAHANPAPDGAHSGSPMLLEAAGETVFFRASNGEYRKELFKSSGTGSSTVLVKDINPTDCVDECRSEWGRPGNFAGAGSSVFFTAAEDGHDFEVWTSDGSEQGTVRLTDNQEQKGTRRTSDLTVINGTVYFSAYDGDFRRELWRSDGTVEGTMMVKDINPKLHGGSSTGQFTKVGDTLFFTARDGLHGRDLQLWKSDGTENGTEMVADLTPGEDSSLFSSLTNVNGTLFFVHRSQLWKSDGTTQGTVMVKDFTLESGLAGLPTTSRLMAAGGDVYFAAVQGGRGSELWRSDGTAEGTTMVEDINPSGPSFPSPLAAVGGRLFFAANDGAHGYELYRTDATGEGASMVKDIQRGGKNGLFARRNTVFTDSASVKRILYISADDGTHGRELWRSDGTREGTRMVANISKNGNSTPRWLVNARGRLFFSAYTPGRGRELWKSTGSAAGTTLVKDIWG